MEISQVSSQDGATKPKPQGRQVASRYMSASSHTGGRSEDAHAARDQAHMLSGALQKPGASFGGKLGLHSMGGGAGSKRASASIGGLGAAAMQAIAAHATAGKGMAQHQLHQHNQQPLTSQIQLPIQQQHMASTRPEAVQDVPADPGRSKSPLASSYSAQHMARMQHLATQSPPPAHLANRSSGGGAPPGAVSAQGRAPAAAATVQPLGPAVSLPFAGQAPSPMAMQAQGDGAMDMDMSPVPPARRRTDRQGAPPQQEPPVVVIPTTSGTASAPGMPPVPRLNLSSFAPGQGQSLGGLPGAEGPLSPAASSAASAAARNDRAGCSGAASGPGSAAAAAVADPWRRFSHDGMTAAAMAGSMLGKPLPPVEDRRELLKMYKAAKEAKMQAQQQGHGQAHGPEHGPAGRRFSLAPGPGAGRPPAGPGALKAPIPKPLYASRPPPLAVVSQAAATPLPDSNDAADALASPVLPGTRGFGGVAGPRGQQSARGSQEELQAGLEAGPRCSQESLDPAAPTPASGTGPAVPLDRRTSMAGPAASGAPGGLTSGGLGQGAPPLTGRPSLASASSLGVGAPRLSLGGSGALGGGVVLAGAMVGAAQGLALQDVRQDLKQLRLQDLQWRFINAKVAKALAARQEQSERALAACTLAVSHLAACVAEARALATRASEQQRVDLTVASQAVDLEAWGRLQERQGAQVGAVSHALHSSLTAVPLVGGAYCGSPQAMDMQVLQDAMDRGMYLLQSLDPYLQAILSASCQGMDTAAPTQPGASGAAAAAAGQGPVGRPGAGQAQQGHGQQPSVCTAGYLTDLSNTVVQEVEQLNSVLQLLKQYKAKQLELNSHRAQLLHLQRSGLA